MKQQFQVVVEDAFGFLRDAYGFRIAESDRSTIVYESPTMVVSMFYDDQRSMEVSLSVARKSSPSQPAFSFDEILRAFDVPPGVLPSGYAVGSAVDAGKLAEKIASIMASYGRALLEGCDIAWERLREQRQRDLREYALKNELKNARVAADEAWHRRDYRTVVKVLEPLRGSLSSSEVGRLKYSAKRLGVEGSVGAEGGAEGAEGGAEGSDLWI